MDSDDAPPELAGYHPSLNSPVCATTDVFANSMVGRAVLEWNSRIGVPLDAWRTIISVMVFCVGCKRVRSCDGNSAHLDIHGQPLCRGPLNDESELEIFEISPKGKGKARQT